MPGRRGIPEIIKRSPEKSQRTWLEVRDSAIGECGDRRRAEQTAYAALKRSFEKVGDRWQPKLEEASRRVRGDRPMGGGVKVSQPRGVLLDRARGLGIAGTSRMTKQELAAAIAGRR